jgi:hypothetical protein
VYQIATPLSRHHKNTNVLKNMSNNIMTSVLNNPSPIELVASKFRVLHVSYREIGVVVDQREKLEGWEEGNGTVPRRRANRSTFAKKG